MTHRTRTSRRHPAQPGDTRHAGETVSGEQDRTARTETAPTKPAEHLTDVQVRDLLGQNAPPSGGCPQLRALGYRCSLAWPGNMDVDGRKHLLSNAEFRALALSHGPHPLDLMAHSVASSTLNRRYTFPAAGQETPGTLPSSSCRDRAARDRDGRGAGAAGRARPAAPVAGPADALNSRPERTPAFQQLPHATPLNVHRSPV